MRKILFRAKHVDDDSVFANEWVCGDLCHYANGTIFIRQQETGSAFDVLQESVGEFTGLFDKNGKEIYEGDIINIQVISSHIKDVIINEKCSVVFYNGCFGMAEYGIRKEFVRFNSFVEYLTSFEIVGNIYDNPELLTQSEK